MHSASLDVVRKALAILKFISLCTLIFFRLFYVYFIASIQSGDPNVGEVVPLLCISFSALHVPMIFQPIWINFDLDQYIFQSRSLLFTEFKFVSIIILKYFILVAFSKSLFFKNTLHSFPYFRFLLHINMVLDFS